MAQPTEEGLRRYPTTNGYNRSVESDECPEGLPCVCVESCKPRCAGECGCKACQLQFDVFCEGARLETDFREWTAEDRKNALTIYRDRTTPLMFQPTLEGFRRYPHTNGRYAGDPELPCKCEASCEPRCDGFCGCDACVTAFTVFCDESGYMGPAGLTVPYATALSLYRSM